MKAIRTYSLESEADPARIALEGAGIPAVVVGVGIGMKSGVLLVPEDRIDAALKVLEDTVMSSQSKAVSPLRQGMIEDMRMRKLAPHTQAYGAGFGQRLTRADGGGSG
jgi:hypothetical protein